MKLGNLGPNEKAVVTIKLIESQTELVGGAYSFRVPNRYFPRYKVEGDLTKLNSYDPNKYKLSYKVDVAAPKGKEITYLSKPSFAP